jgi:nifR3 family TIM-barrel protein
MVWNELPKPFFALAPMEDVTDTVFRKVMLELGKPDLMFTEFTSVEGMFSPGSYEVTQRLKFTDEERPLIAQIWGTTPENYMKGAKMIRKMGFDGVDLNFGCPVKKIVKQGACSALIKNKGLASEIIEATKKGAGDLPVSVKTRIGFDKIETEEWVSHLLSHDIAALTIHGRTAMQLSTGVNNWKEIGKAVKIRDEMGKDTLIIGNGDVLSKKQGRELVEKYNLDGIMIGRGVFNNPWVFNEEIKEVTTQMRMDALLLHVRLYEECWGEERNFHVLKRFFKIYVKGFDGAGELRRRLMETEKYEDVYELLKVEFGE